LEQVAQGSGGVTVPEVFKTCVDAALTDMVSVHGEDALAAGLHDLSGLFPP